MHLRVQKAPHGPASSSGNFSCPSPAMVTITCADCGAIQTIGELPPGATAECHRCDRLLARRPPVGLGVPFACAVATFVLLPPAVFMPLLESTIKNLVFEESRLVSSVPV